MIYPSASDFPDVPLRCSDLLCTTFSCVRRPWKEFIKQKTAASKKRDSSGNMERLSGTLTAVFPAQWFSQGGINWCFLPCPRLSGGCTSASTALAARPFREFMTVCKKCSTQGLLHLYCFPPPLFFPFGSSHLYYAGNNSMSWHDIFKICRGFFILFLFLKLFLMARITKVHGPPSSDYNGVTHWRWLSAQSYPAPG